MRHTLTRKQCAERLAELDMLEPVRVVRDVFGVRATEGLQARFRDGEGYQWREPGALVVAEREVKA